MTYKGAIDEVKMLSQNPMMPDIFKSSLNKIAETLEMEKETEPCEDAISRQAVIDSFKNKFANGFDSDRWWNSMSVLYVINKVPPVQPKPIECEDAISRMRVFSAIHNTHLPKEYEEPLWNKISDLPSVQPIRPKGKWIVDHDAFSEMNGYILKCHCSECHHKEEFYDHKSWTTPTLKNANVYNYCPNCGADMRGEKECATDAET